MWLVVLSHSEWPRHMADMDFDTQLDDQMKSFLSGGGAIAGEDGSIELSRVFKWFGSDFVRPTPHAHVSSEPHEEVNS